MDYFHVFVLKRLSLDKNGDVKSRNVAVTFDLFEAEDHMEQGRGKRLRHICRAQRLAGKRRAVRVDFCDAGIPRHGQGYARTALR